MSIAICLDWHEHTDLKFSPVPCPEVPFEGIAESLSQALDRPIVKVGTVWVLLL
jgi:hypothetical protein